MVFMGTGNQASKMHPLRPTYALQQKRTFLGLRRFPAPKPAMMGYLVAQGLAVVLLADFAIATALNSPTTIRAVCQSAGFWKDDADFGGLHAKDREV